VKLFKDVVDDSNNQRKLRALKAAAATMIQRRYRKHCEVKVKENRTQAILVISTKMVTFIKRWRIWRKIKAADFLLSFFKEVYDVSKLMKIVKKFRLCVIKAQQYSRAFLEMKEAQVITLRKYW
jgi:hypothetical protein